MEGNILLVEDDHEIARIIRDTLMMANYNITWATTGIEGLEDFQAGEFDLVLLDWMLPEMDGIKLTEHIRLQSDIPIIMISARGQEVDKVEGLQGADDYLTKPFSLEELKARIASQLRRWGRYNKVKSIEEVVQFTHGLRINYKREQVFHENIEISLTQKEFALLKLFTQHPYRLFTKEELYTHVWQQPELDEQHTVTVHIKGVREKLKDPVKQPHFIQTIWGKGYRFVGEEL